MTLKTARKYELIAKIATSDEGFAKHLRELCDIDYDTAFDMWEFALNRGADVIAEGITFFNSVSESKFRTMFCENLSTQKALFAHKGAGASESVKFLASLIIANKLEVADDCLNRVRANTHLDFNDTMRAVQEAAFSGYCQKNGVKVPVFNKKQRDLLLEHVNKIKGANKALLLQRMKEL